MTRGTWGWIAAAFWTVFPAISEAEGTADPAEAPLAQDYDFSARASMMTGKEDALWVLNDDAPRCTIVSLPSLKVEKSIPLERKGTGLVEKAGSVFVLLADARKIQVFDGTTGQEQGVVTFPEGAGLALAASADPEDPFVYALVKRPESPLFPYRTRVYKIDAKDRAIRRTIELWHDKPFLGSVSAAVSPDGRYLYLAAGWTGAYDLARDGKPCFDPAASSGSPAWKLGAWGQAWWIQDPKPAGAKEVFVDRLHGSVFLGGPSPAFYTSDMRRKLGDLHGGCPAFHSTRPLLALCGNAIRLFSSETGEPVADLKGMPGIVPDRAYASEKSGRLWLVRNGSADEPLRIAGVPVSWGRHAEETPLVFLRGPLTLFAGRPWKEAPRWKGVSPGGLSFRSASLPAFLTLDAATGALSGTPSLGDIGIHPVRVEAFREEKRIWSQEGVLTVRPRLSSLGFNLKAVALGAEGKTVLLLHEHEPVLTEHPADDPGTVLKTVRLTEIGCGLAVKGGKVYVAFKDRDYLEAFDAKTWKPLPTVSIGIKNPGLPLLCGADERDACLYLYCGSLRMREPGEPPPGPVVLRIDSRTGEASKLELGVADWPSPCDGRSGSALSADGRWLALEFDGVHVFDLGGTSPRRIGYRPKAGLVGLGGNPPLAVVSGYPVEDVWRIDFSGKLDVPKKEPLKSWGPPHFGVLGSVPAWAGGLSEEGRLRFRIGSVATGEDLLSCDWPADEPLFRADFMLESAPLSCCVLIQKGGFSPPRQSDALSAERYRESGALVLPLQRKEDRERKAEGFRTFPDTEAAVGKKWTYRPEIPDGTKRTWRLAKSPAGMEMDEAGGEIRYTPLLDDVGEQEVRLEAAGAAGDKTSQEFRIRVRLPLFARIPQDVFQGLRDRPLQIACDGPGETAAVLTSAGKLVVLPREGSGRPVRTIDLGSPRPFGSQGSYLAFRKNILYAASPGSPVLCEVDPLEGKIVRRLDLRSGLMGFVLSPAEEILVAATQDQKLRIVSLAAWKEEEPLGPGLGGFFSADGTAFYAFCGLVVYGAPQDAFQGELGFLKDRVKGFSLLTYKRTGSARKWACWDAVPAGTAPNPWRSGAVIDRCRLVLGGAAGLEARLCGDPAHVVGTLRSHELQELPLWIMMPPVPLHHPKMSEVFCGIPGGRLAWIGCKRFEGQPPEEDAAKTKWVLAGKGEWFFVKEWGPSFWGRAEGWRAEPFPPPLCAAVPDRPAALVLADSQEIFSLEFPAADPSPPAQPRFVSEPSLTYVPGKRYSYRVKWEGAPGAFIRLQSAPEGMTLDEKTGEISWVSPEKKEADATAPRRVAIHLIQEGKPVDAQAFIPRPE